MLRSIGKQLYCYFDSVESILGLLSKLTFKLLILYLWDVLIGDQCSCWLCSHKGKCSSLIDAAHISTEARRSENYYFPMQSRLSRKTY